MKQYSSIYTYHPFTIRIAVLEQLMAEKTGNLGYVYCSRTHGIQTFQVRGIIKQIDWQNLD